VPGVGGRGLARPSTNDRQAPCDGPPRMWTADLRHVLAPAAFCIWGANTHPQGRITSAACRFHVSLGAEYTAGRLGMRGWVLLMTGSACSLTAWAAELCAGSWCPRQHSTPQACATATAPDIVAMHVRTRTAGHEAPSNSRGHLPGEGDGHRSCTRQVRTTASVTVQGVPGCACSASACNTGLHVHACK